MIQLYDLEENEGTHHESIFSGSILLFGRSDLFFLALVRIIRLRRFLGSEWNYKRGKVGSAWWIDFWWSILCTSVGILQMALKKGIEWAASDTY